MRKVAHTIKRAFAKRAANLTTLHHNRAKRKNKISKKKIGTSEEVVVGNYIHHGNSKKNCRDIYNDPEHDPELIKDPDYNIESVIQFTPMKRINLLDLTAPAALSNTCFSVNPISDEGPCFYCNTPNLKSQEIACSTELASSLFSTFLNRVRDKNIMASIRIILSGVAEQVFDMISAQIGNQTDTEKISRAVVNFVADMYTMCVRTCYAISQTLACVLKYVGAAKFGKPPEFKITLHGCKPSILDNSGHMAIELGSSATVAIAGRYCHICRDTLSTLREIYNKENGDILYLDRGINETKLVFGPLVIDKEYKRISITTTAKHNATPEYEENCTFVLSRINTMKQNKTKG